MLFAFIYCDCMQLKIGPSVRRSVNMLLWIVAGFSVLIWFTKCVSELQGHGSEAQPNPYRYFQLEEKNQLFSQHKSDAQLTEALHEKLVDDRELWEVANELGQAGLKCRRSSGRKFKDLSWVEAKERLSENGGGDLFRCDYDHYIPLLIQHFTLFLGVNGKGKVINIAVKTGATGL